MDAERFNQIVERRIRKIRDTVCSKAGEYATGGDRLYNFKDGARFLNSSQAFACWSYMAKHLGSVKKMAIENSLNGVVPTQAMCDEKLGDIIVYCILMEGIFEEERPNLDAVQG